MRVALVHDYLTQRGGAERVALALTRAFPSAPLYTSLYDPSGTFPEFSSVDIRPSPIDRIGLLRRRHRLALPLLAPSFGLRLVDADVVVCSSSGWAHGIRCTGSKIVYCHSPAKWLYRSEDYLGSHPGHAARLGAAVLAPGLRSFDRWAAASANKYLANSTFIAEQIESVYGVTSRIVPPPLTLDPSGAMRPISNVPPGYLLSVARLLPYKNVAETIDAVGRRGDVRLMVVGDGPQRRKLEDAAPPNVRLLGEVNDEELRWLYANCVGLVAASREDFGLTPLEAGAFGKPVAALRWGGFLDTVREGETGVLFDHADPESIDAAISKLLERSWDDELICAHAGNYREERFIETMRAVVAKTLNE